MAGIEAYSSYCYSRQRLIWSKRIPVLLGFLMLFGLGSLAQSETEYDKVSVFLEVSKLGAREIDALVIKDEVLLPVNQVFDFFNIRINPSTAFKTISGFILDRGTSFSISWSKNEIHYQDRLFKLQEGDLINTDKDLYLKAKYFDRIFGLECNYSLRNQALKIEPELEIPVIRELRQGDLRVNLNSLVRQDKSDVELRRSYPVFNFGVADWSIMSKQEIHGPAEAKVNLSLGSVLAGGELSAAVYYNSAVAFRERDQHYLWRIVDDYNTAFSQITVGKITTLTTASIEDPVIGVQLSNTPTSLRRSPGTYTISDRTEPNWIVELYVNNVLVSFAMADASGFFTFVVPLTYGALPMRLKFYGPWGEERTRERTISLPFSFVPEKILEYDLSAGFVEDSLRSRLLRLNVNYGVSQNVTIGAGFEYLSSVIVSPQMPFVEGSFRLTPNLILTGGITYKVRARSTLTYRLPANIQIDLNYSKYNKEQQALYHNHLEERSVSILMPINLRNYSVYNKMTFNQILARPNYSVAGYLPGNLTYSDYLDNIASGWLATTSAEEQNAVMTATKYTFAEWLISASLFGINTNFTTSGLITDSSVPSIYSKLSLSYRFGSGFRITPSAQYGYSDKKLHSLKIGMEKKVFTHAYLNLSFEQDFIRNLQNAELGFRYNFNFAQTGISGIRTDNRTSFVQQARGSLISDRNTNYFKADNISNVGKGGITIIPYFDRNSNGKRDSGEVKLFGLNLRSSAGQIERIEKDTTIRILSLEAYTNCIIEFDDSEFDDPPLKLQNSTYSVPVDPNMLKEIEVPLIIAGKASGTIRVNWDGEIRGQDGVVVLLYNEDQKRVGRIFSKLDGTFMYDGLSIGSYVVKIDSTQLQRIGRTCTPDSIRFEITPESGGTTVTGLDFMLETTPEPKEELPQEEPDSVHSVIPGPVTQITRKDTSYIKIHELVQEVTTDTTNSYAIQLGAFGKNSNATAYKDRIAERLGRDVEIVLENGLYKVRILDFESREEVDEFIPELGKNGIEELWVINLRGMRQQMTLMTVRDTITEVIEVRTEMPTPDDHSKLNLQMGAFRDSDRAEALRLRLSTSLDQPVIILEEDNYFKVRLTGFTMPEQRNAILPQLSELGFTDVWVLPYDRSLYESEFRKDVLAEAEDQVIIAQETEVPLEEEVAEVVAEEVVVEEVAEEVAEVVIEEVVVEEAIITKEELGQAEVQADIDQEIEVKIPEAEEVAEEVVEEVIEVAEEVVKTEEKPLIEQGKIEKPLIEQPRFSIQAGIFTDFSEAKKAQRRIMNKLGLQSILTEEYDYTRLLIPGFYTRQETYKYYPELAGLGYDKIQIIEKR